MVGSGARATVAERVQQDGNTPANGFGTINTLAYNGGRQYLLLKVTQQAEHGSDILWTSPVWFEQGSTATPTPTPGNPDAAKFIASKNSEIFHVSLECKFAKSIKSENRVTGAAAAHGREVHEGCPVK